MIHVSILSLKQTLYDGDAQGITAPGTEGEFTILPSHVPFLSSLKKGVIMIHGKPQNTYIEVPKAGVCEFSENRASILIEEGEKNI